MSEYTATILICDRCHPDFLPGVSFFPIETVKGVFRGDKGMAAVSGWQERDYGEVCPDCARIEAEESGDGEGEVIMGQAALESVTGAQNDD
jgi:hypothetical protein